MHRCQRPGSALLLALLLTATAACKAPATSAADEGKAPPSKPTGAAAKEVTLPKEAWEEIDRLVAEDKMREALGRVETLLAAARQQGAEEDWTRALIRQVQIQSALGGFETAVEGLTGQSWPERPFYRSILHLFHGASLVQYLEVYSWEIRQRERIETTQKLDLKQQTQDQIFTTAQAATLEVWKHRAAWGAESVGSLAEYIEQNSYPARIRGTLRDAVTYLWVELLANSSYWRAEHENGVTDLDLRQLLGAEPGVAEADLASPEEHPLARIATLLADLETWHLAHSRPEAAFEARLERLRRLRGSFDQEEDRKTLSTDLAQQTERLGKNFEWWSMGMAERSEWKREESGPNSLKEARELALAGAQAHPESAGGHRCTAIVTGIEAPAYQLTSMAVDAANRRSLQVQHQNLETLWFRAWRLPLLATLEASQDYNMLPAYREIPAMVATRTPDAQWQTTLPTTPDFRTHTSYVTPPIETKGLWVIVASARKDFNRNNNQLVGVNLILSDLVLLTRRLDNERGETRGLDHEVTVVAGGSGRPVAGAEVRLYAFDYQRRHRVIETRTTDADGRVRFVAGPGREANYFLFAQKGEDQSAHFDPLRFRGGGEPSTSTSALVYTDRSVYRPEQEVLWKVVAYRSTPGKTDFATQESLSLAVDLRDPNGQIVATEKVKTNRFGSASGRFRIPSGRILGGWSLQASVGGSAAVRVEEYKRPTFEVALEAPAEAPRLNRPTLVSGNARYYFGLPVSAGEARWRVTREPVYPRWWWGWWSPPRQAPQVIAKGRSPLDAAGKFEVAFSPKADERQAGSGVSYLYRVAADVTDEGGETRSAEKSFRIGFVAVEARFEEAAAFRLAGKPGELTVTRTDLAGEPRDGIGRWRLVELVQPKEALLPSEQPLAPGSPLGSLGEEVGFETAGDRQRPRWEGGSSLDQVLRLWSDGREVAQGSVEHGADGKGKLRLAGLPAGAYRLLYETTDPYDEKFEMTQDLVVAEPGKTPLAVPLALVAEQATVPLGGTARLLLHSGLKDQVLVLEIFQGGKRLERRTLASAAGAQVLEIPITVKERGGLSITVSAVRDHQALLASTTVTVPWDDKKLAVSFSSFRDRLRPGARETWRVNIQSADGIALGQGAAELLAYMYDRSLDLFAPHLPPQPWASYPGAVAIEAQRANLTSTGPSYWDGEGFVHSTDYPTFTTDRLKFFDSYGIGGPGRMGGRMMSLRAGAPMPEAIMTEGAMADSPPPPPPPPAPAKVAMAKDATVAGGVVGGEGAASPEPQVEIRSNFAETAFWEPHLVTGEDGSVAFEFQVPDSVTDWNVWVHALTTDLRSGSLHQKAASVKDLMVRPYLPRFLREGDEAALKVVVNNAGATAFTGTLDFSIEDPETGTSLLADFGLTPNAARGQAFNVAAGGSASLSFPVKAPNRVGPVAFRVTAKAGDLSDGELRPLPVLPGRYHLAQSRFVTVKDKSSKTLSFADMVVADPTRINEQLVVTLDAQLFYGVLQALPYLSQYPYECTEQTLNRFVSTGIVSSLYERYPAVGKMAAQLSKRTTQLETWEGADPNRKMALEETPWLEEARGGSSGKNLINVLDPRIARAQRDTSLAKLKEAQTSLGAFPWWPGGPPSPYMTLYLLHGFSRALEFDIELPQDMVVSAWGYMHRHYLDEISRELVKDDCCWESITFLNYVLSSYPDESWTGGVFTADDRRKMLDFSFRHWKKHSPLLKSYLALTLERAGRQTDAQQVFDSVMDSAQNNDELGTFWAPEDRAWLWYNDTIETHAFALRTLSELEPADARRHGLVHWLFLNKKLNHWKSTRATAEVIYSLVHYLEKEGTLGAREDATVTVGAQTRSYVFEPSEYTGKKNQWVIPGAELDPKTMSTVKVAKESKGLLFASATWHFSTEKLPPEERGDFFQVTRRYFKRVQSGREWVLEPLAEGATVATGDQLEVQLSIRAKHEAEYVHLRDPRGAGFEPETLLSGYKWDLGIGWYEEVRDSGTNFFFERLPAGEYTFKYRLRANLAGSFKVGPATLQSMYAPEFNAYSAGARLVVAAP